MKLLLSYVGLIAAIIFGISCNSSKKAGHRQAETAVNTPLRGIYWKLTGLLGQPVNISGNASEAFIKFNTDGKSVGGNGGCNAFGGSYSVSNSSHLTFGPIMSTKMYCEDAKFENTFFDLLSKTDSYLITGDTLYLRNAGMDSTAKFVANYFKK